MYPSTYFPPMTPPPNPSGYRTGYVLAASLTFAQGVVGAYGVVKVTGLSFLICFLFVVFLHLTKMFFLRSQNFFERFYYGGGWDRLISYSLTACFSVALTAFGLYCLSGSAAPAPQQPTMTVLTVRQPSAVIAAPADGSSLDVLGSFDKQHPTQESGEPSPRLRVVAPKAQERGAENKHQSVMPERLDAQASLPGFMSDTFIEQKGGALGCWVVPGILELVILGLLMHNRPRYLPYHFME